VSIRLIGLKCHAHCRQIAQELLKRELPLRIRLLGIRLSTLQDLTLPDTGIRNVSAFDVLTIDIA